VCRVKRSFVFDKPLLQTLFFSCPLVTLLLLVETTFEKKLIRLWQNDTSFFRSLLAFHVFFTIFPSNQLLDQFKKHNYSPIDKLSMICSRYHHNRFITKILHFILLVNNRQDGSYPIGIL